MSDNIPLDIDAPNNSRSSRAKTRGRRDPDPLSGTYEATKRRERIIKIIYVIAIIIWIFLSIGLGLFAVGNIGVLHICIFMLPIVIFIFGIINSGYITIEVEDELFIADYLPFGLIIVIPLLTWISKDYSGNKRQFINMAIAAIVLSMLSILDIWVHPRNLFAVKHSKSALQTMSISLIVYAIYSYYRNYPTDVFVS